MKDRCRLKDGSVVKIQDKQTAERLTATVEHHYGSNVILTTDGKLYDCDDYYNVVHIISGGWEYA